MTTALAPTQPLLAGDRCDRCGAQAYIRVRLLSGGELLFCAHHGKRYREALEQKGAEIHDESSRLASIPPTAPDDEH